jgi:hypothetical protein
LLKPKCNKKKSHSTIHQHDEKTLTKSKCFVEEVLFDKFVKITDETEVNTNQRCPQDLKPVAHGLSRQVARARKSKISGCETANSGAISREMCGGAILANFSPDRSGAPAADSRPTLAGHHIGGPDDRRQEKDEGRFHDRRRVFEAEFQLFEEDNDDETPIEAVSAAGRSRRNCPFLAGATSPGGAA